MSLNIDILFYIFFVWEFLRRMLYMLNTYNVSFVYFSGVQESNYICSAQKSDIGLM